MLRVRHQPRVGLLQWKAPRKSDTLAAFLRPTATVWLRLQGHAASHAPGITGERPKGAANSACSAAAGARSAQAQRQMPEAALQGPRGGTLAMQRRLYARTRLTSAARERLTPRCPLLTFAASAAPPAAAAASLLCCRSRRETRASALRAASARFSSSTVPASSSGGAALTIAASACSQEAQAHGAAL